MLTIAIGSEQQRMQEDDLIDSVSLAPSPNPLVSGDES